MIAPDIGSLFEQLERSLRASEPILTPDSPIYIYGAGNVGKEICRIVQSEKLTVSAFLDRNAKPDATWETIPILLPASQNITPEMRKSAQVIVGTFNRDADTREIAEQLNSLGYGRIISFLEFHDEFHERLGDRFWLTSRDFFVGQRKEVTAAEQLWSDDASRDLYRSLLHFRFSMRYDALPEVCLHPQYFPSDIPSWRNPLRFADCGAYDGDTLRDLVDAHSQIEVEAVAAFEPDLVNYGRLAESARTEAWRKLGNVCLFPCAVGATNGRVRFSEGHGEASSISDSGEVIIQCVNLDSALAGFRPNLIKMDIEGSELDALAGSQHLLREYRPGLAICVYHRPSHLWEIPLWVNALLPGGRHYLRGHAHNGFDVVYYWVP